jgi:hypothetical protein
VTEDESPGPAGDRSPPSIARVYDYWLGGTNSRPADRALGDQIRRSLPAVPVGVRAQRALLGRVVRYLVTDAGLRQLLDIGSGLPTADNVHEIAQRLAPGTHVVYVDNDPAVVDRARAILAGQPDVLALPGDLRRPAELLSHPQLRRHLDFGQPIGLLLCGILHHILDGERPGDLVDTLTAALAPGSYVFIHHLLDSGDPAIADVQAALQAGLGRGQFRTRAEIAALFHGLELVEPGLVLVSEWRPTADTPSARDQPVLRLACAGVARKA